MIAAASSKRAGNLRALTLVPPKFSLAERDRRFAAVRAVMRARGLACLLFPHNTGDWDNLQPDTRYMTCIGGGGMATALFFPLEGEPIAAVRESRRVEWWRAQQNWITDIRFPPKFRWSSFFVRCLTERCMLHERIGMVGLAGVLREPEGTISHGEYEALRAAAPSALFESATDVLYEVRKRKSVEEMEMVERAQGCADAISHALRDTARPGAWQHDVYAAMIAACIERGGEATAMLLFQSAARMWQTQLLPEFRKIESEEIILVEAEPKYFGYMAQAVETVSMRPLSSIESRLLDVSERCFVEILDAMRPGESYRRLTEIWVEHGRKAGFRPGRTMGHGLGLGQDGPLTTPEGPTPIGDLCVEDGDCFVLKPWFANEDDTVSGRVGGTVVVGPRGARRIGVCDIRPYVASA